MNPVPLMKLVEIIRGIATDAATYETAVGFAKSLGKTTANAEDFPAFIVNRVLVPMINEAIYTLYEGVGTVEAIDTAMKLGANHPMGPLELGDFIGLDTVLSIMNVLHDGLADSKYRPCPLLVKYVEAGWLGRKSGRGFYDYRGETSRPDALSGEPCGVCRRRFVSILLGFDASDDPIIASFGGLDDAQAHVALLSGAYICLALTVALFALARRRRLGAAAWPLLGALGLAFSLHGLVDAGIEAGDSTAIWPPCARRTDPDRPAREDRTTASAMFEYVRDRRRDAAGRRSSTAKCACWRTWSSG